MKRSEKKVLKAIMRQPCRFGDLLQLRLPTVKVRQATESLLRSGCIQFDGSKYHIKQLKGEDSR